MAPKKADVAIIKTLRVLAQSEAYSPSLKSTWSFSELKKFPGDTDVPWSGAARTHEHCDDAGGRFVPTVFQEIYDVRCSHLRFINARFRRYFRLKVGGRERQTLAWVSVGWESFNPSRQCTWTERWIKQLTKSCKYGLAAPLRSKSIDGSIFGRWLTPADLEPRNHGKYLAAARESVGIEGTVSVEMLNSK